MKVLSFLTILALAIGLVANAGPVSAQAYGTAFTTTYIYQNPYASAAVQVHLVYYPSPDSKTPIDILWHEIPGGKTVSVFIGTLDQPELGFHGVTYVQSNPKLASIQVQTAQPLSPVKARPITNPPAYASPQVWIATLLREPKIANTILSIRNEDSQPNLVYVQVFDTQSNVVYTADIMVELGETYLLDPGGPDSKWPKKLNGSALLTAVRQDGKSPGKITATALELDTRFLGASSYEGSAHGAQEVFMPSAACKFDIGAGILITSTFAVQNADLVNSTKVTVTYSNGITDTQVIQPAAKASFNPCKAEGMQPNFMGAATIRSRTTPIVAVGKVYGAGMFSAYTGAPIDTGTKRLALPYVRWVDDHEWYRGGRPRTFIAIQNIGAETVQGPIFAYLFSCNGDNIEMEIPLKGGYLAPGGKVDVKFRDWNIDNFGACTDGPQVDGTMIILGPENSHLVAMVRVQQWDPQHGIVVAEDYNAINTP